MADPKWIEEYKAKEKQPDLPTTENMQRKMNGSTPEPKGKKDGEHKAS